MRYVSAFLAACALAAACAAGAGAAPQQATGGVVILGFEWHPQHRNHRERNYSLDRRGDYALNDLAAPGRDPNIASRRTQNDPTGPRDVGSRRTQNDPGTLSMPTGVIRPTQKIFYGYESSVRLKNDGTKTIKAVEWEHVFFKDKDRREELRRFRFRKDETIEPEHQKFIAARVRVSDYSPLTSRARQGIEVKRIEYADGTIWESR